MQQSFKKVYFQHWEKNFKIHKKFPKQWFSHHLSSLKKAIENLSLILDQIDKYFISNLSYILELFKLKEMSTAERKAVVKHADMNEEMQQDAIDCANVALEKFNIEKDIAAYIKKEFDKKYNPTWHCVVGRNFGSYVTHETKHFIYFYMGQVAILLFKSGWSIDLYSILSWLYYIIKLFYFPFPNTNFPPTSLPPPTVWKIIRKIWYNHVDVRKKRKK